jgi:hypothetical protein
MEEERIEPAAQSADGSHRIMPISRALRPVSHWLALEPSRHDPERLQERASNGAGSHLLRTGATDRET